MLLPERGSGTREGYPLGYVHVYVYVCENVYVYVCMCVYVYVYVYVCLYLYLYLYMCGNMREKISALHTWTALKCKTVRRNNR